MDDALSSLFSTLVEVGATVSLGEGGKLVLRAPHGAIDAGLRQAIVVHRDAIVEHLRRNMRPSELDSVTVACLEYGPSRSTTVFCFHGFQGTVGFYRPLARVVSAVSDVYGIQAVGVDLRRQGFRSFDAMADYYADQIALLVCERVLFVGWCIGAPLAIETAQRLRKSGCVVEAIVVADPWLGFLPSPEDRWRDFLGVYLSERPVHQAVGESLSLSREERLAWLARERRALRPEIGVANDVATLSDRLAFWDAMDSAVRDYRYRSHGETLRLFLSDSFAQQQFACLEAFGDPPKHILKHALPDEGAFGELGQEILSLLR